MKNFHGTGVALITPFLEDGNVDFQAFAKLIEHCLEGGVDYLVVLGTTGEVATLSKEEKKQVLQEAISINKGRVPIVYGLGGNNTQALVDEINETDFEGIDAILSVSPYYNRPSQAGIIAHYQALADACPVPVILYNVPGRTGSNLSATTTLTLAQHSNIIGIKEASGDLTQCMEIASKKPHDFLLISGDDMLTASMESIGGVGVISVLANAYPQIFKKITQGTPVEKKNATLSLLEINPLMYAEGNPVGLKFLLKEIGICGDQVRLPLVKASLELRQKIKKAHQSI
ncbi:MAG: 4-hydroxy-tetrahydrodipicolinate synthase [Algoriphagus sp.]|uniref:4-hydroxy-tetrahydrodipicolinate synthase n=1 Tax=Algoriphagus sp. TaxID=1872435 RepID=UPI001847C0B4|nr:4-hydroxy-tetrahydrodipicolinate synthase [Algoriphagus sp.]NVJ85227.1 4-hydroxy-tetrahydrodipicolinate synthase [Algoriphagus sp.]